MKTYIDFNTDKQKKKCQIVNVRLVKNAKDYTKYTSKRNSNYQSIFSKNCVAIREIKPVLTLNEPIYERFSIQIEANILCITFIIIMLKKASC